MLQSKCKVLILLGLSLLMLTSCFTETITDLESSYNDYVLYDPHLQCNNLTGDKIRSRRYADVSYYPIRNVSEETIMGVNYGVQLFSVWDLHVVQNPDRYQDIFGEWTIKSVGIYTKKDVAYSSIDLLELQGELSQDAINELKTFYGAEKERGISYYDCAPDYTWEGELCYKGSTNFYICINYEDAKNIYWEMEVFSFCSQDTPDERILSVEWLTVGEEEKINSFYASLSDYPALCDETLEIIGAYMDKYHPIDESASAENQSPTC